MIYKFLGASTFVIPLLCVAGCFLFLRAFVYSRPLPFPFPFSHPKLEGIWRNLRMFSPSSAIMGPGWSRLGLPVMMLHVQSSPALSADLVIPG
ncbi:hypothetical protein MLD38_008741 [Melastoma candidum]|uniref:Uncharacterized protein n=1 Tax=Melastoma candidum TaxID=119954 RepID=A0ACB9RV97_9MYRT|nr:hypothetical protein MLD38_008741 [Melastoma candidum]